MHPREHWAYKSVNTIPGMIEMIILAYFWYWFYIYGLFLIIEIIGYYLYSINQHVHPKYWPPPHTVLMDFVAETIRWLRYESPLSRKNPRKARRLSNLAAFIFYAFMAFAMCIYLNYLINLYSGGKLMKLLKMIPELLA